MGPAERVRQFQAGLSSLYLPMYLALAEKCLAWDLGQDFHDLAGYRFAPYQGLRSFQQQDADWLQGRQGRKGGIITNARGGESPHQYGCATDWAPVDSSGRVIWLKKDHPIWPRFASLVESVPGLKSGIHFSDPDHSELWITCDWKHVLVAFNQNGMTAAQQHIESNLHRQA